MPRNYCYCRSQRSGKTTITSEIDINSHYINADDIKKEHNCTSKEASDKAGAIKESLLEGEKIGTDKIPIKFRIIVSPLYECITYAVNENEGIKLMNEALSIVKNTIEMKGGNFLLEEDPLIV